MQRLLDACFWPLSRFAAAHQFANELRHSGSGGPGSLVKNDVDGPNRPVSYTQDTDSSRGIFVSPSAWCII
jgi:hypothetical protein